MNNLAEEYINSKWMSISVWNGTIERIVEHYEMVPDGNSKYFIVRLGNCPYNEPIKLKLLNDLWKIRSNFVINGVWTDRLYDNEGIVVFSVITDNNRYWEIVYRHQGKRYPKPRRRKSKAWRERISKKASAA